MHRILRAFAVGVMLTSAIAHAGDQSQCTQTTLFANVLDLHGKPLEQLPKSSFRIKLNKIPFDLEDARYEVKPNRIVVVLDTSGSMAGNPGREKWEVARTAVEAVTRVASPQVPIALIAFSDQVEKILGFGERRSDVVNWPATISGKDKAGLHGRTALFDAIAAADKMLEPHQEGDAIYAITDGQDTHSTLTAKKLEIQLLRDRVRLFAFVLNDQLPIEELQEREQDLADVVADTGGFIFGQASQGILSGTWNVRYSSDDQAKRRIEAQTLLLIVQVGGFYRLRISPMRQPKNESRVSLEIVNDQGKHRKDLVVTYPRRISSCAPSPAP